MSTPITVPAITASSAPVAGTPVAAVVDKRWVSNQAIAITLRPNGDPRSDSVATFTVDPAKTTAADIAAWVAQEKARVETEYAAMQAAHTSLLAAIG